MTNQPLFTTRRDFLTGSFTFLSAASTLPIFLGHTAQALAQSKPATKNKNTNERILVVVQLAGGNDGLNTVVPYEMDPYYKMRPRLAIPKKDVLKLKDGLGLHPSATGLKELFDAGKMAIVQGVGYPNPNRSHFTSMDIWHTADPEQRKHNGWIGRYFDNCCKGSADVSSARNGGVAIAPPSATGSSRVAIAPPSATDPEPISGIALMQESPLAMSGERFTPLSFENPDALIWRSASKDKKADDLFRKLNNIDGDYPEEPHELARYLQRAALKAQVGADEIKSAAGGSVSGGGRRGFNRGGGGQLAQKLQLVTRLIAADLPTRIYYVSIGGFDTHTGQEGRHQRLMQEFGSAMNQFIEQLEDQKLLDRVLVMTFSEFGRRVQENASAGTDHGEAAPMFLFGSAVNPGLHEKHPDLTKLRRGDLEFGCDFRRVYATVLRDWLKVKPEDVLGKGFEPLKLIDKRA